MQSVEYIDLSADGVFEGRLGQNFSFPIISSKYSIFECMQLEIG